MKLNKKMLSGIAIAIAVSGASADTVVLQQGANGYSGVTDTYIMTEKMIADYPNYAADPASKDLFHLHRC